MIETVLGKGLRGHPKFLDFIKNRPKLVFGASYIFRYVYRKMHHYKPGGIENTLLQ